MKRKKKEKRSQDYKTKQIEKYYKDGTLRLKYTIEDGKIHGALESYYPSGKKNEYI